MICLISYDEFIQKLGIVFITKMARKRLTISINNTVIDALDNFVDGNTIRNRSHAIETILSEKFGNQAVKKAIILGGGRSIKFREKNISKLLLPIQGKTLIERNIEI